MNNLQDKLSYLITVSRQHFLPAQFLIINLRKKTNSEIVIVGNLNQKEIKLITSLGAKYINENDINFDGRLPKVIWKQKYKPFGWYKSMFIRHCIDKFMTSEQVVILDAEVFPFDNWDETKFYDPETGDPRSFYWTPKIRKSNWDYKMYRGAAYLLSFLPECEGIMEYANSDSYKRHISGVVLFSTKNVQELWRRLKRDTDLDKNIDRLFNHESDLAFSDHDIYGLAVEYGLFEQTVPTVMHNDLLGWYDNHDDPNFHVFRENAMWSMCQQYFQYTDATNYYAFMHKMAHELNRSLPQREYWNEVDKELIAQKFSIHNDINYFKKYEKQLNHTFRRRFSTMHKALELLHSTEENSNINIVEIGTLRDNNKGGGHSTYKFGEYCSKFGGKVHTVDILPEAIKYSMKASGEYQPWIEYYVQDSEVFLNSFTETIDLLYLDGYDSTPGNENKASQKQLNEIKTVLPKLKNKCIVLLDDADLPEGGKAKLSSQFLIDNGFELIIDSYQQLYGRGFSKYPKFINNNSQTLSDLDKLVDALPEVYQSIYLHGKLIREGVRKNDFERLEVIKNYIKPKQTILDIGSNVGFFTINLAKLFPDNVFVSVEKQYSYARLQQKLIELEGINNVILIHSEVNTEWLIQAAQACTFFDVTLLLSVLHHIPNADSFLTHLNKVSKSFIIELPHPNEVRVCGKEVLRKQLTLEKIGQVKPIFTKLPYESTTHCDTNLKRSFYYADSPNYQRESIYPYIGYPLAPRSYNINANEEGLTIHKTHLNQDIQAIPGVLFSDLAQIGQVMMPKYENCIQKIESEFDRLERLDNVADIRPWNILFTAHGIQFIDYEYTPDLDSNLKFHSNNDLNLIKSYFSSIFNIQAPPKIIVDGVFFQLYKTGIARVWKSLLEEWANSEFREHILVLDRAGTAPKIPGIKYRTVPAYSYNNTDADREMLQQVCDEEGAELFISTYYTTPIDTPSVFMAYDMIPEVVGADLSQPMWQEKHKGMNHASAFIAISKNTAQDITKFFPNIPSDSISVAHCGVNPLFSPASDTEINAFKYRYGINKPYFLLGSLGGYKNSILFFQAFAQLANKQGFDIVVTGASSQLPPEWRQYTVGCTVHGLQLTDEELRLAYAGAVALVYPSKYEGFGMPLIEAMACGCPVITCANGSIPEVAGDAAIYVNDDDVEGMANAICEVQKPSVRNTLIPAGLQQAKQFYWSKMANTVSSVLIDTTLLRLNLKEHNFIIFPDWSQPEESVGLELQEIIETLSTHPNRQKTTLLIDTSNITVEDAELFLYSVAMNLFMNEDSDITEELEIALVGDLADIQWEALLPRIQARIVLKHENQEALEKSLVKKLPYLEIEKFQLSKV